jgi:hypothetical protein
MENPGSTEDKTSLSRREFTRKGIMAVAALGSASLLGYGLCNGKKLRSLHNALRIGHCAPSVMQTLLEIHDASHRDMVLYAGAMAGGIAGSETECGCLTAPLMFMGYQQGHLSSLAAKLDYILASQKYIQEFSEYYDSTICGKIRKDGPVSCIRNMCTIHKPLARAKESSEQLSSEAKESYSRLLRAFDMHNFHCAHSVLHDLRHNLVISRELLDSSWIFVGGLAMLNRTCGALAAGVVALGALTAKTEYSYIRVVRMNRLLMQEDARAMNEDINNFNRCINLSEELGTWFRSEFGFVSCRDIWGYDFSKLNDTEKYLAGYCMNHCAHIAQKVAQRVSKMI